MSASKNVFLNEEQIVNALAFSLLPSLLGELSKVKKQEEHFKPTACYDTQGKFVGYVFEKTKLIG